MSSCARKGATLNPLKIPATSDGGGDFLRVILSDVHIIIPAKFIACHSGLRAGISFIQILSLYSMYRHDHIGPCRQVSTKLWCLCRLEVNR